MAILASAPTPFLQARGMPQKVSSSSGLAVHGQMGLGIGCVYGSVHESGVASWFKKLEGFKTPGLRFLSYLARKVK